MKRAVISLILVLLFPAGLWAAEEEQLAEERELDEIRVVDTRSMQTSGASSLSRQQIDFLPQTDGAVTDLLKVLPGIQFNETDDSSLTGGEILPPEISISGGRIYDNNFMIDGLGNNSLLNPAADNPTSITDVPGHSQELFLDTDLIDAIRIYRSNISARYSGFTGGVVDITTRDPDKTFSGEISGRSTRSEWTSFKIARDNREAFEDSEDAAMQPEFRKYYGHAQVSVPLTDNMAILAAYSKNYSKLPLTQFEQEHVQRRLEENFFAKYFYQPTESTELRLSFLATPYEARYFKSNVKDSDFTVEGGGTSFLASLKQEFSLASLDWSLGYRTSENNRQAPDNFFNYLNTLLADWGGEGERYSLAGWYGDIETQQKSLTSALHVDWTPFTFGGVKQAWISGLTLERSTADYERGRATNTGWKTSAIVTSDPGDIFCLPADQYAYRMTLYPDDDVEAEISFVDAYLEDTLSWWRLSFRPGLHVSYNDFMKNTDYAGRFSLSYDLFGDGSTLISAGRNRYYGKTFLTYALDEDKALTELWTRSINGDGTLNDWVLSPRTSFAVARVSDLDTPYVDEWSVSLEQDLFEGRLTLSYIDRDGEDLLAKQVLARDEAGYIYSEWNNNGESRHQEVTLSWERQWTRQYLLVNATWQDSESSNEGYNDLLDLEDLDELVWFHEHTTARINLPRSDYNREWSANLIYRVELPYGFTFTNTTRYRSGYRAIVDTGENYDLPDGERVDIYDDVSYPSATVFDWSLSWTAKTVAGQALTLTADVLNVFNKKVYIYNPDEELGDYQLGRRLWLEARYTF
ncbi:MAG: TonB-dependent receptor plug domain-containing protein [Desulfuromonadaceae bacterium]|nr:TonB-dependent receptor plug domain-containing protein [Desulfuromonadaceae bacterium]